MPAPSFCHQRNPKGLGGARSFGLRRRLAGSPHPGPATCAPHRCPRGAAAAAPARAENPSDRGSRSACRRRRGRLHRMSGPLWTRGRAGHAPSEARVPRGADGWEEADASSSPARVPGRDARRFLEESLAGRIGAREHDPQTPDWDKIRGEAHLVPSPSVLPYLPSSLFPVPQSSSVSRRPRGSPVGAQVLGSVYVLQGSDPDADSEEMRMLRDRGIIFLGCDCGFLAPRLPGTAR